MTRLGTRVLSRMNFHSDARCGVVASGVVGTVSVSVGKVSSRASAAGRGAGGTGGGASRSDQGMAASPAALADRAEGHDRDKRTLWADALQHRFRGRGALAGHPVGNLLLAGLSELLGDPVAALDELRDIFGVDGRVLPMSLVPLDIEADVSGLESDPRISRCIRGQVAVATTPGKVRRVRLLARESTPVRLAHKPDSLELLAITQDQPPSRVRMRNSVR